MQTNLLKVLTTKKEQLAGDRLVIVDSTVYMTLIFVAVVLLLHHVNYTTDYLWEVTHRFFNPYEIRIDKLLQKFAVGGFLLLSGYKLSISKLSEPAGQFLINRIKRIYPLYLIAIWVFSFSAYPYLAGEMPSRPNLMVHILGLQSVFPNLFQTNFLTIWFVSTLFCCYLLFLWLRKYLRRSSAFLIRVALFLVATALIRQIAGTYNIAAFTEDFDTYTLFFCSGMLCAQHRDRLARITRMNKWALAGTSIVSTVLLVAFRIYHPDNSLFGSAAVGYLFNIVAIWAVCCPYTSYCLPLARSSRCVPKSPG
ncbi:MAG: acyltransferase family protein [Phormidesmis sp.]